MKNILINKNIYTQCLTQHAHSVSLSCLVRPTNFTDTQMKIVIHRTLKIIHRSLLVARAAKTNTCSLMSFAHSILLRFAAQSFNKALFVGLFFLISIIEIPHIEQSVIFKQDVSTCHSGFMKEIFVFNNNCNIYGSSSDDVAKNQNNLSFIRYCGFSPYTKCMFYVTIGLLCVYIGIFCIGFGLGSYNKRTLVILCIVGCIFIFFAQLFIRYSLDHDVLFGLLTAPQNALNVCAYILVAARAT